MELPAELSTVFDLFNLNYLLLDMGLLNRHLCFGLGICESQVVDIKLELVRRCLTQVVLLDCYPVFLSFIILQQCFKISYCGIRQDGGWLIEVKLQLTGK